MNTDKIIAYIDASNLRFWVAQSGWELDYKSFRSWLRDKFWVTKAILLRKNGVPLIILDDFKNKLKKKPPDTP